MRQPLISASGAASVDSTPCPVSWITRLTSFDPGLRRWTPAPRFAGGAGGTDERAVFELVISKPQSHVYEPRKLIVGNSTPSLASIVARSPGYCRTMIGLLGSPLSWLVKRPV